MANSGAGHVTESDIFATQCDECATIYQAEHAHERRKALRRCWNTSLTLESPRESDAMYSYAPRTICTDAVDSVDRLHDRINSGDALKVIAENVETDFLIS